MRWIYVVVDNAGYRRAKAVRELLARPGCRIKLIFLPSYAPNLNATERLWGVMHREVTHNKCYATFDEFAAAIGGAGDDTLQGGDGSDSAVYSGSQADYAVVTGGGGTTVTHLSGSNGVDTLQGIEQLVFDDGTVLL